jgi:tRNA nucleotidyltransferase/poly(A) polymerase
MAQIKKDIDQALKSTVSLLKNISHERIRDEFLKGIKTSKNTTFFLKLYEEYKVFVYVFGSLILDKDKIEKIGNQKDVIIILATLLQNNNIDVLRSELSNLKYTSDEITSISFLVILKSLNIDTVFKIKKAQTNCKLTNEQIYHFSTLNNIDMHLIDTFLKFNLSVSGKSLVEKGFKGKDIGIEQERLETNNFISLLNK